METVQKLKYLIVSYLTVLIFLLLCVAATPLVIRHGMAIARKFIIEEETLETVLIAILFAVSYLIWIGFRHALKAYMRLAVRAGEEKSRLISRLAEAFSYIVVIIEVIPITIAAMVQYDALPSIITNKASLIYKDHVTIQTSPVPVDIQGANVSELAIPLLLPETGAEYPSLIMFLQPPQPSYHHPVRYRP